MTIITLPPGVEALLAEEARKQGTTPERLALDCLRRQFALPPSADTPGRADSLFDFLSGYVGTVSGTSEALSENCGRRFADGLIDKQRQRRL